MRADLNRAEARLPKQPARRAFPHLWVQSAGVRGVREEMRDRLLQPWGDVGRGWHDFLGIVAGDVVTQPHFDAAVPKPGDPYVDFAVVDLLKLCRQVHKPILRRTFWFRRPMASAWLAPLP